MESNNAVFLLNLSPVLEKGGSATADGQNITTDTSTNNQANTETGTSTGTPAPAPATANTLGGSTNIVMWVAIYAVVIFAMYYFTIRPQRKRDKEMKEMQKNITAGDNVVTSSGMFGKVVDVGEDCFVVEFGTNRGIRVPIRKADVLGVKSPTMTSTQPKEDGKKDEN